MAEFKPCIQCGNPVKFYPYDLQAGRKKYCSKVCLNKSLKGKHTSIGTEFKKGDKGYWYGKSRPEIKDWLTPFETGHEPWNKGIKTGITPWLGKKRPEMMGGRNPSWKGNSVGYGALHDWIKDRFDKPNNCPRCGSDRFIQLSNVSGEYKRDLNDWQWLCAKCHKRYDMALRRTSEVL